MSPDCLKVAQVSPQMGHPAGSGGCAALSRVTVRLPAEAGGAGMMAVSAAGLGASIFLVWEGEGRFAAMTWGRVSEPGAMRPASAAWPRQRWISTARLAPMGSVMISVRWMTAGLEHFWHFMDIFPSELCDVQYTEVMRGVCKGVWR